MSLKLRSRSLWEDIHEDILEHILDEIVLLSDVIRFGAVCKKWYRVFLQRKQYRIKRCNNEVPLLHIKVNNGSDRKSLSPINPNIIENDPDVLFNIFDQKCYNSMSPVTTTSNLKRTAKIDCRSSPSYGWLVKISIEKQVILSLINPITGNTISLPTFPEQENELYNFAWSCDPSIYPDKCVVAFLGRIDIWVTRLRENKWTRFRISSGKPVISILFHKGQLYALHKDLDLLAIDCLRESNNGDNSDFGSCYVVTKTSPSVSFGLMHLVESVSGELLVIGVTHFVGSVSGKLLVTASTTFDDTDFKVYKLVTDDDDGKKKKGHWDQIHRLYDDQVLFLGLGNAICSKSRNLQPDSVYFIFSSPDQTNTKFSHYMQVVSLNEERKPKEEPITLGVELEDNVYPFWINPTLQ